MAKPGRFTMTDGSGAPLHSLGHRQGFVGDHRLQRGARALLGGGDGGVSFSERRQHLEGQLLQAPVTLGRSRRRVAYAWDAANLAACLIVCLPTTASPYRQRLALPYGISGGRAVITQDAA
jgi:hypothetical protein